ncbi:hypothetical protein AB0K18_48005 [Nonomuraea sp. NPDC049421]|uniref:NACHT domain-containing protein n=1 Tax=Nonomuraea sp. NPDC049421 TaxID=3155275 RepID=UPI00341CFA16
MRAISPKNRKRLGLSLFAILTVATGVLVNRVEGMWWIQAICFIAATVCVVLATAVSQWGSAEHQPAIIRDSRTRRARKKLVQQILPRQIDRLSSIWLENSGELVLDAPKTYVDIKKDTRGNLYRSGRDTTINSTLDALQRASGRLAILGDGGSGKTYALLGLASHLVDSARKNSDTPIPFYIDLAGWISEGDFISWCLNSITQNYGISRDLVEWWATQGDLALIFDGLDELERRRRVTCVAKINEMMNQYGLNDFVIASRAAEYRAVKAGLNVRGQLELLSLTHQAVLEIVEQREAVYSGLSKKIRSDRKLRDLLRTPLFIALALNVYADAPSETIKLVRGSWKATILTEFFARVESRATKRHPKADLGLNGWLPRLAAHLTLQNESVFYPDRLPRTHITPTLKQTVARRAAWYASAIFASIYLGVRLPYLWLIEGAETFPVYAGSTIVSVVAFVAMLRIYAVSWLKRSDGFQNGPIERKAIFTILIRWIVAYCLLGAIANGLMHAGQLGNQAIGTAYFALTVMVGIYPGLALIRASTTSSTESVLPKYPGQENRSLIASSLASMGIVAGAMYLSMFMWGLPWSMAYKEITPIPLAVILPYFIVPFAIISALANGGIELIFRYTGWQLASKTRLLPNPYWHSFYSLQKMSVLIPSLGGYTFSHSLIREYLASRAKTTQS